jgi:hypothetical protein
MEMSNSKDYVFGRLDGSLSSLECSYEDSRDSRIFATNDDEHSGSKTLQANGLET